MIKVFEKGIMVGNSNGAFMHSRSFDGQSKLTVGESKTILARLNSMSKRKKISPDGQLIRTTKFPKNYKDYPYILASFPNSFYEKKYRWVDDAISPVKTREGTLNGYKVTDVLNAYLDKWTAKVETNLKTRMNINYKTVNSKWISKLANTYYVFKEENLSYENKRYTDDIKEYVSAAKKIKL